MKEAQELADTFSDGIELEETFANEIEHIIRHSGLELGAAFDKAFRNLIRHHRAHATMMRAQRGALAERYNLKLVP